MRPRRSHALRAAVAAGALLCGVAATAPARGAGFRVESRLEPAVVGLGGHAFFTIEVEGPGFEQPRLRPRFELENLEVVGGPDVSHGISLGTGGSGWRYSWTWRLRPLEVGPAAVVGVHLLVGEQEVALAPRRLEVLEEEPPGAAPPRPGHGSPGAGTGRRSRLEELLSRGLGRGRLPRRPGKESDAVEPALFLRAVAAPSRPYVGQRVIYTVYLYTQVPVRAMEPERLPTFQGLWARQVDLDQAAVERVEWEGEPYFRKAILQKQLFSMAAATHVVEPARVRLLTERIERDRFLLAPVRVPVQTVRESNPVELEVRPLPAPGHGETAPSAGFDCAVGRLTLEAALEPRELGVDEGAILTVSASGDGHLEALEAPPFNAPEGLEVIGPAPATPPAGDDGEARRHWRYMLVPRRPGSWRLPAIEMPYFDPGAGEYRLARAPVPDLVARPTAGGELGTGGSFGAAAEGALSAPANGPAIPWNRWTGVLAWALALPSLAALVLILSRRQLGSRAAPAAAGGELRDFRRRLDGALREERPRRAAAAVERAWRRFLAAARGVPEAVPAARWPDELLTRGARRETCRELRRVLEEIHYLRFAPELSATGSLTAELVRRSERLARDLVC